VAFVGEFRHLGWILVLLGGGLLLIGLLLVAAGRLPFLGRLPGDIRIQRGGWTFYFPVVTCLLLSLLLTLLLNLIVRLLRH
jgi:membrane protein implicated in regulation of membrane protease activity